jgi:hypothetical protein
VRKASSHSRFEQCPSITLASAGTISPLPSSRISPGTTSSTAMTLVTGDPEAFRITVACGAPTDSREATVYS